MEFICFAFAPPSPPMSVFNGEMKSFIKTNSTGCISNVGILNGQESKKYFLLKFIQTSKSLYEKRMKIIIGMHTGWKSL